MHRYGIANTVEHYITELLTRGERRNKIKIKIKEIPITPSMTVAS
jgi:hypothetical protein